MEVLIALSITAILGVIIVSLMNSASMGTADQQDGRRHLVRVQAIRGVLEDEIHNARSFLLASNTRLVYWTGDGRDAAIPPNNAVNLSELGAVELASGQLILYRTVFPNTWSTATCQSNDTLYSADSDWSQVVQAAKTTGYFTGTVLARNVSAMTVSTDGPSATKSRIAFLTITLNDGQVVRTAVLGLGLRNQSPPN